MPALTASWALTADAAIITHSYRDAVATPSRIGQSPRTLWSTEVEDLAAVTNYTLLERQTKGGGWPGVDAFLKLWASFTECRRSSLRRPHLPLQGPRYQGVFQLPMTPTQEGVCGHPYSSPWTASTANAGRPPVDDSTTSSYTSRGEHYLVPRGRGGGASGDNDARGPWLLPPTGQPRLRGWKHAGWSRLYTCTGCLDGATRTRRRTTPDAPRCTTRRDCKRLLGRTRTRIGQSIEKYVPRRSIDLSCSLPVHLASPDRP